MKKISIFGSYNGCSIGDTAILLGMLSSLERIYGKNIRVDVLVIREVGLVSELKQLGNDIHAKEIVVNTFTSKTTPLHKINKALKKIRIRLFNGTLIDIDKVNESLSDSDHLFIGGGNLIMDLFSQWPLIIQEVCTTAHKLNVSYSFIGVGAGPINTFEGKEIFKSCLMGAERVYFRDNCSRDFCKKELKFDGAFLIPDLASALCYKPLDSIRKRNIILFNVASLYGNAFPHEYHDSNKLDEYVNAFVSLALDIDSKCKFDEVVIFNSNFPADASGSSKFFENLKGSGIREKVRIIKGRSSVAELMKLGQSASLAVTTRLHAGIMVALAGCSVVGIAYQPKVKNVLKELGMSSKFIELDALIDGEFSVDNILSAVKGCEIKNHALNVDNILQDLLEG